MKTLILPILLFSVNTTKAQFDIDKRWRFMPKFSTSIPLGKFSVARGQRTEIGPVKSGFGGGFSIGLPVYKRLVLSFSFQHEAYTIDKESILQVYKDKYEDPNFYSEVKSTPRFAIGCPALELSYRLIAGRFEIEPYFRAGLGVAQVYSNISIERKMKNDHYTEIIYIVPESSDFLFPQIGSYANLPITRWLYAVVSVGYGWGKFSMDMTERKVDFWGSETKRKYAIIDQNVSTIQFHAGIQMRLGKFPEKKPEIDPDKH